MFDTKEHVRPEIFVHVGFPKTASTSLQRLLFSKHPEINYLASTAKGGNNSSSNLVAEAIRILKKSSYESDSKLIRSFERLISTQICQDFENGKKTLLSDEALVYNSSNIKKQFPDAKIIIICRDPVDIYNSWYHQYLKGLGEKFSSPLPMDNWVQQNIEERGFIYNHVVSYLNLFRDPNVGIFMFETLRKDQKTFINEISNFLGIDENTAVELFLSGHANKRINNYELLIKYIGIRSPTLSRILLSHRLKRVRQIAKTILPPSPVSCSFPKETVSLIKEYSRDCIHEISDRKNINLKSYL